MHFVKLWDNLTKSSILEQDIPTRWFWIVMLLQADRDGNVYGTPEALARIANVSPEDARRALGILTSPDPNSTTGDEEGRRVLTPGPNQWFVVNYTKYRRIKDLDEEREKTAERVKRFRARRKECNGDVTQCNTIVEVDVDAEKTKDALFEDWWEVYRKAIGRGPQKKDTRVAVRRLSLEDQLALVSNTRAWLAARTALRERGIFVAEAPDPIRFIRHRRWEDELDIPIEPSGPSKEHLFAVDAAIAKMGGYPSE